jgi:ammonium transporter Rh
MALNQPLLNGKSATTGAFGGVALVIHLLICAAFYNAKLDLSAADNTDASSVYNYYVGVALMMFVGFGYLMTFLKSYGLGAVGYTMFITCIGVEYAILIESYMGKGSLSIDFLSLLNGNFAVAAVLISFGGLIGKISPVQVLCLVIVELTCYCANKVYVLKQYDTTPLIADCGGTIIIHVFGAYFGLCACKVLGPPAKDTLNASSYTSDIFSLVGTVFLWLFWPSFVSGALPSGPGQTTALINTVLALLSSTVVTFALTPMLESGKLTTVPVQNATLAGGVSIGATANLVGPFEAMVIGLVAGALSTWGFIKSPFFGDVDTCGISNLHGMPGICGGLVSALIPLIIPGTGLVAANQAIGLGLTLVVACVTGCISGFVLKALGTPEDSFTDETFWACADDVAKAKA